jgi:hypothetical protein
MKKILILLSVVYLLSAISCTEQTRAKTFGGSMSIDLPRNTKLIEATWKGDDLWYLTRPMREGEKSETYTFKEESSLGLMEGSVTFKEHK